MKYKFTSGNFDSGDWRGDKELEEAELGENITTVGAGVFEDCVSLKTFTFHESLKHIEANAFLGCTDLQEVIIPDTLEEVDCWYDERRVAKATLFNPTSEELVSNLQKGYAMDLYYKGENRDDFWD